MASNYWIKLYHEMLDDPKIGRLTDSQFRLTINLFLLAGDYEQDGYLPDVDDIRWRLRNPEGFDDALQILIDCKIISIEDNILVVEHFAERQGAMSVSERQQRRRERLRKQEYYCNEPVTNRDTDRDKDIDKDIDVDKKRRDTSPKPPFISEFVSAVRVQFTNNDQPETIKDLVNDYGEDVVLQAATWYGQNKPRNMGHALKSIETALSRGWRNKESKHDNEKVLEEWLNGDKRTGNETDPKVMQTSSAVQTNP